MFYINQLEHRHVRYDTNVLHGGRPEHLRNIASNGCGICSVCMMIELLTDKHLSLEEGVKISEECGANHSVGTDMQLLAPAIAEKFNLNLVQSNDPNEAIRHLQNGGQIVVHVGIPEGKTLGLFTKGGHYMCIIATDGANFCILDPSYTPEKYEIPERAGRVNTSHAPYLYCDVATVDSETKARRTKYYMFSRKCD